MYKLSKFNYYTENLKGQALLFNTLKGPQSFAKIPSKYANLIEEVFDRKLTLDALPSSLFDSLKNLGYIINDDINEDEYLKMLYLEKTNNSILNLTILPTEKCNFRCKYCYESFPNNIMPEEIQNAIIKYLHKNLKKYSGLHISWFGGEPLEALDVISNISEQVITLTQRLGIPYTSSITTNAYELTPAVFRQLLKYRVLHYQITIDGIKSIHDYQRPHINKKGSTYDRIINNLVSIRDTVNTQTFDIMIRSNFSTNNLECLEEYKNNFYTLFGNDKRFRFFIRPVMDWGGDRIECFSDQLIKSTDYSSIYKAILQTNPPLPFVYNDFLECGSICYAGNKNSFVITPKGDIYKCTCDFSKETQCKIGEITPKGTMEIDQYKHSQWVCTFSNCSNKECFFLPICFGDVCPSKRIFKKKGNQCPLEKKDLSHILQILDQENEMFKEINIYGKE